MRDGSFWRIPRRPRPSWNLLPAVKLSFAVKQEETAMKIKAVVLAAAFALASTCAVAQSAGGTAGGSSKAGGPGVTQPNSATRAGGSMKMRIGRHHHRMHHRHHRM